MWEEDQGFLELEGQEGKREKGEMVKKINQSFSFRLFTSSPFSPIFEFPQCSPQK